jgi:Na+/proline symporter
MTAAVSLSGWDWFFVAWFMAVTLGVGLWYGRRGSRNLNEYFLSGRSLPWWALGTSMVATTFAADTPLVVAGFVVEGGIARNWVWWNFLFGATLTVFLFSRLWRRSEVVTEIELIDLRYDGRSALGLRVFKASYLALVVNSIIFGFVTKAMLTVVEAIFPDVDPVLVVGVLVLVTFVYTAASGLWGVVATDVLQFVMAMLGSVLLAWIAVREAGGLSATVERAEASAVAAGREHFLDVVPSGWDAFTVGVLILVLVNWWAVYYPGAEPGGGGYVAQRMMAARDERHARAGTLWFVFAHYVLRPWPWILVALAAIALEPRFLLAKGVDGALPAESAYPWTFQFLPVGLRGLVVASFLAAYMSTITTTLNLSASYLVNDVWLPLRGARSAKTSSANVERHQVWVARLAVLVVAVVGAIVSLQLVRAGDGWTFIMDLTAGSGLVLILRWLWWRISAFSEIAAMAGSAVAFLVVRKGGFDAELAAWTGAPKAEIGLCAIVLVSTVCWLLVTALTPPVGESQLRAFYARVRPGGAWGPIARLTSIPSTRLSRDVVLWLVATAVVFAGLFGLGSLLLLRTTTALANLTVMVVGALAMRYLLRAEARADEPATTGGEGAR